MLDRPTEQTEHNSSQLDEDSAAARSNSGLPGRLPLDFGQLSYSRQYDHLFAKMPLDVKKPVPKPSPTAQQVGWTWQGGLWQ